MRLIDADAYQEFLYQLNFERRLTAYGLALNNWLLSNAQTIDAVPVKHAKLVNPNPIGECSMCGYLIDIRTEYHYCPNCGAKLDIERKDDESHPFADDVMMGAWKDDE